MIETAIYEKSFEILQMISDELTPKNYYVYHYTSPDGFMNIIQPNGKAKLWFTQYDSLNDASERVAFESYYKEYCSRKKHEHVFSDAFFAAIYSLKGSDFCGITNRTNEFSFWDDGEKVPITYARNTICNTYLCCFSTDADSLAMWNYYSKSGKYEGYNIGFLSDTLQTVSGFEKGYNIKLIKVIYSDRKKEQILDESILPLSKLFDEADDKSRKNIIQSVQSVLNNLQFAIKNECFAHEKEVRAILRIPREGKDKDEKFERKYRQHNGLIIPYVEFDLNVTATKNVTIAPLLRSEIALKNTKDFLLSRGHNLNVKLSNIPIRY